VFLGSDGAGDEIEPDFLRGKALPVSAA